jgi:hypothetical protein
VIVYSNFEDQCLCDLQVALPDFGEQLGDLRARLVDLLPIIRRHVYDPGFAGSFSIKAVLPAMVPGQGYDDLEIREGSLAAIAFWIAALGSTIESLSAFSMTVTLSRGTTATMENNAPLGFQHFVHPQT